MIEEEYDGDPAHYLPRGEAVYTTERLAKGDIKLDRRDNQFRAAISTFPIDWLLERGTIDYEQHKAGLIVLSIRKAIRHSLGIDRMVTELLPPERENQARAVSPSVYLNFLQKGLLCWQVELLNRITSLQREENDRESRPLTKNDLQGWVSRGAINVKCTLDRVSANLDNMENLLDEHFRICEIRITQGAITTS